jgi:hypothetical protein
MKAVADHIVNLNEELNFESTNLLPNQLVGTGTFTIRSGLIGELTPECS